ncbi:MAG: phospholipase D-like domain-containing protein [Gemmatimonadota bacterium]|nr:phospholipase D-like domain-containing protein [Gemmatimonadota bacterium]
MRLLVQPDQGVDPVLEAIAAARAQVDMYIFRLAHAKIQRAIAEAVERGVVVRTLIAHTANNAEDALRKLELCLLDLGATVSRTDEDLVRYHGKMMIVDSRELYVLGYNFTRRDIDRSRSLGIATDRPDFVQEAIRLFEADFNRKIYTPGLPDFVVSPLNSRSSLLALITSAERELLIYDARLSDNMMQRALEKMALQGVRIRVIGKLEKPLKGVEVEEYPGDRLHVRAIVQDGRRAFVGSQSLRRPELERRREIGVIFEEADVVKQIVEIFERDWADTDRGTDAEGNSDDERNEEGEPVPA